MSRLPLILASILLITLVVYSRLAYRCSGPGSLDSALYLTGISQMAHQRGRGEVATQVFNQDTARGYYAQSSLMLLDFPQTHDLFMRSQIRLTALLGTATVLMVPLIGRSMGLGGWSCLWLLAAGALIPRFWGLSLIIQPVVHATCFFLFTLLLLLWPSAVKAGLWPFAFLPWTASLLFRADFALASGALFFLPTNPKENLFTRWRGWLVFLSGAAFSLYLRRLSDPLFAPSGAMLTEENFSSYFTLGSLPGQILKYLIHTLLAVHPILFGLGLWGLVRLWKSEDRALARWLTAWLAGALFLLPFRDIDFARITCWTHPVWPLAAALGFRGIDAKRKGIGGAFALAGIPLSSILLSAMLALHPLGESLKERLGMIRYTQPISFLPLEWNTWNKTWEGWLEEAETFAASRPGAYEISGPEAALWTLVWLENRHHGPLRAERLRPESEAVYQVATREKSIRVIPDPSRPDVRVTRGEEK